MSIPEKVNQVISAHLPESRSFIMGVSGGPDSMALLYLFHLLKKEVFVVHINYGLRGNDSDADQELVEGMASMWGFDCCSVRLNPKEVQGNFQNWAREQRYQIFRDFMDELNADAIIVAHHQNDQVETVLQKLFRGSSADKWKGLTEWDGEILRPLLHSSKQEIITFCEDKAVPYRIDQSNLDEKYARNFLRGSFSSQLDKLFPGWKSNILALSDRALEAEAALGVALKTCIRDNKLSIPALNKLPDILLAPVMKRFIEVTTGYKLSKGEVENLPEMVHAQIGAIFHVGQEFVFVRDREYITPKKLNSENVEVKVIISREDAIKGVNFLHHVLRQGDTSLRDGEMKIDFDLLEWPLTLRNWKQGDCFIPFGMEGTQKVSDHLINRKVNASEKDESLILKGTGGTIYAVFFPKSYTVGQKGTISELVKVTEKTISTLTITL